MSETLTDRVRQKYAEAAAEALSASPVGADDVARAFGYSADELASLPDGANLGLSCGNPTAFAGLRPGEVVVDLGCGGGLDVLLAAPKVGPTGRAIGIDVTPEMIRLASRNADRVAAGRPANVDFRLGTLDALPLADESVDCLISNCVINLTPDKRAVFREMFRVLRPGGRVALSDIALKGPMPAELAGDFAAYVGCLAGAIPIDEYRAGLTSAGFVAVQVVDEAKDLNAYGLISGQAGCCSPAMSDSCCEPAGVGEALAELARRYDFNEFAASVRVYALKGDHDE